MVVQGHLKELSATTSAETPAPQPMGEDVFVGRG